jgi:hypothetical protein
MKNEKVEPFRQILNAFGKDTTHQSPITNHLLIRGLAFVLNF